jgi:hypothetical protein
VQNTQLLTSNLSRLQDAYNEVKLRVKRNQIEKNYALDVLSNYAEFTSYSLIATDSARGT